MGASDSFEVGVVAAVHGLGGALRVRLYDPSSSVIDPGCTVRLRSGDGTVSDFVVRRSAVVPGKPGMFRVELGGVADRDAALALVGRILEIDRAAAAPPSDDEFFLADAVGLPSDSEPTAAVVVWAAGRRCALAVEGLVGQTTVESLPLPDLTSTRACTGVAITADGEVVPILHPGVLTGEYGHEDGGLSLDGMQCSALAEVANIGSGNAATALSVMLGRTIDISCPQARVVTVAEAADSVGQPTAKWAIVDTPLESDCGKVLLLFPEEAGAALCALLGTSMSEEMGRSALREVGNILASSYLIAIGQMTGFDIEPMPPTFDSGLLGTLIENSLRGVARAQDATVMMRSNMSVEATEAGFSFLFVPHSSMVTRLLDSLGVGDGMAAAA